MTRSHRIGTITFGITMIVSGILFLVHMFWPALEYRMIFKLWPCIFILLGAEILIGNRKEPTEFVYDGAAVVITLLMVLFAMGMGVVESWMSYFDRVII